ncbi:hypothetical protein B566_EDAN002377 [Ephemera danica]|nr:hypothetical protein B566_EDAN002377 [Ephemera danica]
MVACHHFDISENFEYYFELCIEDCYLCYYFLCSQQVQVLKALVLGEEERGQSQYQVMCFASHFGKEEGFIAPDAMAKLRQKNPGTVRTPEEDRGRQNATMDALLEPAAAARISPHLPGLCAEARDATYVRLADLRTWATMAGVYTF